MKEPHPHPIAGVRVGPDHVQAATKVLLEAAYTATEPDSGGARWVPGLAIAVVHRDEGHCHVVYCDGFGVKRLGVPDRPGPDTLFACASLSKPMSATLLADHLGKLTWNSILEHDVIHDHKPLAVRTWLAHRSGLPPTD